MATEKATDTTATQNLEATSPAPAPARPARARATKATPQTNTVATAAPRKPRSRAKHQAPSSEILAEAAAVEGSLLEAESSKLLQAHSAPAKPACKAHCGQCGREMRFVPFSLSNLMCRSCYGLDRYRRPTSPSLASATPTRPSGPR